MRSIGPALLLLFGGVAIIAVAAAFLIYGAMATGTHGSGGYNNPPVVNRQPAYGGSVPNN